MKIIRFWVYPEPDKMESAELPTKVLAIIIQGVFDLAGHEWIGVLLEDAQTGAGAEIDPLAAIHGTRVFGGVVQFTSAGSFIFWQWYRSILCQILVILFVLQRCVNAMAQDKILRHGITRKKKMMMNLHAHCHREREQDYVYDGKDDHQHCIGRKGPPDFTVWMVGFGNSVGCVH